MLSTNDHSVDARLLPHAVRRVFGDTRGRIDGDLLAVGFGRDLLISVEEPGVLRFWNPASAELTRTEPLLETETCWSISPDARRLASGGDAVAVWNVRTGQLIRRIRTASWAQTVAISPDGRWVASGHDDFIVRLWNIESGTLLRTFESHNGEICALTFHGDGSLLASAGEDRIVVVWDTAMGAIVQRLTGHTDRIDALAWSPDGNRIASAGWDTSVRIWDVRTGDLLGMMNGQGQCVHAVQFHPDGLRLLSSDSDGIVRVWDTLSLNTIHVLRGHQAAVKHLAISGNGELAASGGCDRCIRLWQIDRGEPLIDDLGATTPVASVVVGADKYLGVLYTEGDVQIWSMETAATDPLIGRTAGVASLAYCNGHGWAVGGLDGTISIVPRWGKVASVHWQAHETGVLRIAAAFDGRWLATSSGSDGTVKLWDPTNAELTLVIPNAVGNSTIETLAFHPSRPWLLVGGINWFDTSDADGAVAIWDCVNRCLVRRLDAAATRLAVHPDGKSLAIVNPHDGAAIWDLEGGCIIETILTPVGSPHGLAFDRQGRWFVAAADDNVVHIWNAATWRPVEAIDLGTRAGDLAFVVDGSAIVTGNRNSTCYLLSLEDLSECR